MKLLGVLQNFCKVAKEKKLSRIMSIQNVYSLVNRVYDIANSEVSIQRKLWIISIFSI